MIAALDQSIEAGVGCLRANQKPSGHFRVWVSPDPQFPTGATPEESVFATACILYNLEWLHTPAAAQVRSRGLDFLRAETSERGLNRYFASSSQLTMGEVSLPFTMPFDVDTTACVSGILRRYGVEYDNKDILLANRNEDGLFPTWLMDEPLPEVENNFPFICLMPAEKSPCTGVNANMAWYLGESEVTAAVVQHLQESFCRGEHLQKSGYYLDEIVLFYLYSRAYFEGVKALGSLRQPMTERLLAQQKQNGSFGNALKTAWAICTLRNFDLSWPGQAAALQSLMKEQAADGSWPPCSFYVWDAGKVGMKHFFRLGGFQRELPSEETGQEVSIRHFGSEEITTAYCLEALSRSREALR